MIRQSIKCPSCDCEVNVLIGEDRAVTVEPTGASPYIDKKRLIEHYKKVKGLTLAAGAAWDKTHRLRAFHTAKKILSAVPVVETAKRAVNWTAEEWVRRRLGVNEWNLSTVEKWLADFLVDDARRKTMVTFKCIRCYTAPAVKDSIVCRDCSWCPVCDADGREPDKSPGQMVADKLGYPICRACFDEKA